MLARLALASDEKAVIDLARMQVEETLPHLTFDEDVTRATFSDAVYHSTPTIFVAEDGNRDVVGYAMCLLEGYAFSSGVFVVLEALYVRPDKRGSRAAVELVRMFDRWGDVVGAKEKVAGVANGQDMDRKGAFFRRLGFDPVGGYFKKVA